MPKIERTVTVTVTAADIQRGRRQRIYHCPIALALQRALQNPQVAAGSVVYIYEGDLCAGRGELPEAAQAFMECFDEGHPVSPFSFQFTY